MMRICNCHAQKQHETVTYRLVLAAMPNVLAETVVQLSGKARDHEGTPPHVTCPVKGRSWRFPRLAGLIMLALVMSCSDRGGANITEEQLRKVFGSPIFGVGLSYVEEDFGQKGVPVRIRKDIVDCIWFLAGNNDGIGSNITAAQSAFATGLCRAMLLDCLTDEERNPDGLLLDDLIEPVAADRINAMSAAINADAASRELVAKKRAEKRRNEAILAERQNEIDTALAEAHAHWASAQALFPEIDVACARFDAAWDTALPFLYQHQRSAPWWNSVGACQDGYQVEYRRDFESYLAELEATEPHLGFFNLPTPYFMSKIEDLPDSIYDRIEKVTSAAKEQKRHGQENLDAALAKERARWDAVRHVFPKIDDACSRLALAWEAALPFLGRNEMHLKNISVCQDGYLAEYQRRFVAHITELEAAEPRRGFSELPSFRFRIAGNAIEDVPAIIDRRIKRFTSTAEKRKQREQERSDAGR